MAITDMFRVNKIKADLEQATKERDQLKATLSQTEHLEYHALLQAITDIQEIKHRLLQETATLEATYVEKQQEIEKALAKQRQDGERRILEDKQQLERQKADLIKDIEEKKKDVIQLDEEMLLQSFAFYQPKHDLLNAEAYKVRLEQIRDAQEAMIKSGRAVISPTNWSVNNSQKEGRRMVGDFSKMLLRSFNNECDASLVTIKFNNVHVIINKVTKAFETLNKLGKTMGISITIEYFQLKQEEIQVYYEYQLKKQEEKEALKLLREQMREEAKVLKEIEEAKLKLAKEEKHFTNAMVAINMRLQSVASEAERVALEREQASIQLRLDELARNQQAVMNREQNTRAGYVYIISNMGAFGEHVYKIGVTRRLDPQERIDELGDASVPFEFDIHALIFSDNAPALENALHKAFEHRRLNMINRRREFFRVTLEEIEEVVKTNFKKPVEFVVLPDAAEYRQSLVLRGQS